MSSTTKPTKQQLREYLYARHRSPEPPPTPDRIREELGWRLVPRER
jgi:hypothetical protein